MTAKVRLGDVDRRGRLRLDAAARYLQDVATDDANDAELDRRFGWLVRRTAIRVVEPLGLGEPMVVDTWCTALGRSWAERRSQLLGERGGCVDAVSLWVQIDAETGRPARLAADFVGAYGATAAGRTVSPRLSLAGPAADVDRVPWPVRRVDLDPFGHVNNASTWAFVEQAAALDEGGRCGVAELEYPLPLEPDMPVDLCQASDDEGRSAWLMNASTVVAAARLSVR